MRKTLFVLAALMLTLALVAACGGGASGSGQTGGTTGSTGSTAATAAPAAPATAAPAAPATAAPAAPAAGDVKAGEALFVQATIGTNPGCKTCHNITGAQLVGPNMEGIGTRAATRVPGESAEQYIRTSITDPNVYIVEGFAEGIMPSYKTVLSDTQLNDLVAYLLSLK